MFITHSTICSNGQEIRRLIREHSKTTDDFGTPIPEESELDWRDDEDTLFELAKRITGLQINSMDEWGDKQFVVASLEY